MDPAHGLAALARRRHDRDRPREPEHRLRRDRRGERVVRLLLR
jgi:hypothetical protein